MKKSLKKTPPLTNSDRIADPFYEVPMIVICPLCERELYPVKAFLPMLQSYPANLVTLVASPHGIVQRTHPIYLCQDHYNKLTDSSLAAAQTDGS